MRGLVGFLCGVAAMAGAWIGFASLVGPSSGLNPAAAPTRTEPMQENLRERIAVLEAQLSELQRDERRDARTEVPVLAQAAQISPADEPDYEEEGIVERSAEALARTIRSLDPNDAQARRERMERSMALRQRFLELHPDHPEAANHLMALVGESISTRKDEAEALLDRFGSTVAIDSWRIDGSYANVYAVTDRMGEPRSAYDRVIANFAAPERERANAVFFRAYTFMSAGEYPEARREFRELVSEYSLKEGDFTSWLEAL